MAYIYALVDPSDEQVRYVGMSTNPERRRQRHVSDARAGQVGARADWLRELGMVPDLVLLDVAVDGDWQALERKWIAHYRATGGLTNVLDGGDGCHELTELQRRLAGQRRRVAVAMMTPEERKLKFGRTFTAEQREKLADAQRGRRFEHTAEARKKIRRGALKRPRGSRMHSEETKAKMRASQRARRQREAAV